MLPVGIPMILILRFFKRLLSLATRERDEERLRAEIEEHLTLQTADNLRAGLPAAEARRQAALKFGALESVKESYRDQKGLPWMETLLHDTRYALRRLRNAPAFTITIILILALGIGATTSIFTLVYAVLFKSLAVAKPAELYRLGKQSRCCYFTGYSQDKEFSLVSYDLYKHLRDNTKGFSELAAFSSVGNLLGVRRSGRSQPAESYGGEFVSGNSFAMFGLGAYAGRALTARDDQPGVAPVAMMSYRVWQERYGADASVIGAAFDINQKSFTLIGITPPGFFGDQLRENAPDFFLPLNAEPYLETDADLDKVNLAWLNLIGRIRPGTKPASVEAEMRGELKQWLRSHWNEMSAEERAAFPWQTLYLSPGGAGISAMRDEYEHWLRILLLISGFVLLIVCANVANLVLVRGMERRRQTSLSMALGARARRLVRQALTESILLSLLGGAGGLAVAFAGTRLILHFAFPRVGNMAGIPISASPSIPVLLFAFGISLITGVAFGITPAWMATRVDPIEALRGANRSTARTASFPRQTLAITQGALSLVLLSAAGLLTATLHNLENQDFGFDPDRRTVINIEPRLAGYGYGQLTPLYRHIHDSLASLPGVSGVALCTYSPQNTPSWGSLVQNGQTAAAAHDANLAFWDRVTPGYLDVIGNRILRGRGISERDTAASPRVAVINQAFARKFFSHQDPIGQHFGRGGPASEHDYQIVGVAQDIRNLIYSLHKPVTPFYFLPEAQHDIPAKAPSQEVSPGSHFLHDVIIATKPGANVAAAQLRRAMAAVDPNLPVISIRTLKEQVAGVFSQQRLLARLASFFGFLSLVLASIGLYGVTAYNAGQRTHEIGVRVALGARRGQVVALVLRDAFGLILAGLLIGLPLAFATGRFLGSQLYGMNPYDPWVTTIAVLTLAVAALAASLIPALRASSLSPLDALRSE